MSVKALTQNIEISAICNFIPGRSRPSENYYFFAYTIRITNLGDEPAKLLSRHWFISDAFGRTEQVQGDGVVGEQPYLEKGQSFEYTSFCPLRTSLGGMTGTYLMLRNNGKTFHAQVPTFSLFNPEFMN